MTFETFALVTLSHASYETLLLERMCSKSILFSILISFFFNFITTVSQIFVKKIIICQAKTSSEQF